MEYPPQIQQQRPARQNAETQYNPQHRQQQRPRAHFNFLRGCLDEHRAAHQPARHERNADCEVPVAINLTADADFVAADDGQQRFVDILAVKRLGEIGILLVGDGHVVHHLPGAVDNRDIRAVLVVHLRRLPAEVLERHGILRAARKQRRAERVGAAAAGYAISRASARRFSCRIAVWRLVSVYSPSPDSTLVSSTITATTTAIIRPNMMFPASYFITSNLYPRPQMVWMRQPYFSQPTSLSRRRLTCTSTVRLSTST